MQISTRWFAPMIVAGFALEAASPAGAQSGAKNGEWRTYGGDLAGCGKMESFQQAPVILVLPS